MSTLADPKFAFAATVDSVAGEVRRNPDAYGSGWSNLRSALGKSGLYASLCLIMVLTMCLALPARISVTPPNRSGQAAPGTFGSQSIRQTALTAPLPVTIYKEHASIRSYLQSVCNVPEVDPEIPGVRRLVDLNAPHRFATTGEPETFSSTKNLSASPARDLLSMQKGAVKMRTVAGEVTIPRLLDQKIAGESAELSLPQSSGPEVEADAPFSNWADEAAANNETTSGRVGLALMSVGKYSFCRLRPGFWSEGLGRMPGSLAETLPADGAMIKRSSYYRKYVEYYAVKYKLDAPLIMAIMHTESNFNPFAVSKSNALGLMQIVPETAGTDVYAYLTGKRGSPSHATLLEAEYNIQYGITYLHLLSSSHFSQILNTASREMCIIAAYNGGPGAVLRVFDENKDVAIAIINSMAPGEVYKALTSKMPSPESRRYVETVLGHIKNYN